jgi:predicted enzyme related to lactoylglutathione lyase
MNGVSHFEIPADNTDRAEKFYQSAFGWGIQKWDNPEGVYYAMAMTTPIGENMMPTTPGKINGAICKRNPAQANPVLVLEVDEINAAVRKVKDSGGESLGEPVPVGEMGIYAMIKDTEGNVLGLWQNLMCNGS